MIARHEAQQAEHTDIWARLAAALPAGVIAWRQDGRPIARDGKHFARYVAYIDANTVRERLDSVVPGEWSLTLELLPALPGSGDSESFSTEGTVAFKARLQILGVVREDVGMGKDYKSAATDAFKRVAVRFGIGHELYAYEQNWVPVDGDGRYAKPLEDPQVAYERRLERKSSTNGATRRTRADKADHDVLSLDDAAVEPAADRPRPLIAGDVPPCPKCGGRMWDNRIGKRNPKAPDFKCRDRGCDGVIWPAKGEKGAKADEPQAPAAAAIESGEVPF
jgi:hypothetical protein